ncbi:natriuretic peptides B [Microcebus murinus]|uniref:natriuretic peptides B n=1 Tax=Microcebus murinus TaxID=30608 RepID=UPI003F6B4FA9
MRPALASGLRTLRFSLSLPATIGGVGEGEIATLRAAPSPDFCRKGGSRRQGRAGVPLGLPPPAWPLLYKACSLRSPPPGRRGGAHSSSLSSAGRNVADKSEITRQGRAGRTSSSGIKGGGCPGSQESTGGGKEVGQKPRGVAVVAPASSGSSSDMNPPTALPRALLLLLFLHLSLLGGRSHPLGHPSPASELSGMQELLDRLRDKVSELQAKQMALEPLQQIQGPTEAWGSREAAPEDVLGPRKNALQFPRSLQGPKMMRDSGCFGRRLDRIGSHSSLGCNVLRRY